MRVFDRMVMGFCAVTWMGQGHFRFSENEEAMRSVHLKTVMYCARLTHKAFNFSWVLDIGYLMRAFSFFNFNHWANVLLECIGVFVRAQFGISTIYLYFIAQLRTKWLWVAWPQHGFGKMHTTVYFLNELVSPTKSKARIYPHSYFPTSHALFAKNLTKSIYWCCIQ